VKDQRIVDYLRGRAAVEPPVGLVSSIAEDISGVSQEQRPHRFAIYLSAAAAVAIVAAGLAIVINGPPRTTQPVMSPSSSLSTTPSATATASPATFVPDYDSVAEVAQSGLRLYDDQDPASATTTEVYEGAVVYITDRPAAPGWRRIQWDQVFGWIPLELGGRATLRPAHVARCPTEVDVASLAALSPTDRFRCFPSGSLELRGWAQSFETGTGHVGRPAWLARDPMAQILSGTPARFGMLLDVRLDPTARLDFPVGERIVMVGHFGDARSASCQRTAPSGYPSETAEESTLWCRQQFVVDTVRRLGPPVPTPEPVTYRQAPGSPFTVIENAEADALFTRIDTCTNRVGHFRVNFPAGWYTNPTIGALPACTWFAPVPFAVSDISLVPDEVAIVVDAFEGDFGYVSAPKMSMRDDITIGGHEGYRFEQVGVSYEAGGFEALPPSYIYGTTFDDPMGERSSIRAVAESEGASDYVLNKAVLDRIMGSLSMLEP
jgi:hypothetical protein